MIFRAEVAPRHGDLRILANWDQSQVVLETAAVVAVVEKASLVQVILAWVVEW